MYAGTLGGPVIKNVYSQKMVRVVERLAAGKLDVLEAGDAAERSSELCAAFLPFAR